MKKRGYIDAETIYSQLSKRDPHNQQHNFKDRYFNLNSFHVT